MKPLNYPSELQTLHELFKKFKEKKWGMQNFFKMENSEYKEFHNEIEGLYESYLEACKDLEKVKELHDILTKLKVEVEEVRGKEVISNGVGFKINLRAFDDHIRSTLSSGGTRI